MRRGNLMMMGPEGFLTLVNQCGLELEELDLAQLARRKIVVPWESEDGESHYTGLHLYVVAEYLRAIRPTHHPWSQRAAKISLQEVSALGEDANGLLGAAGGAGGEISAEDSQRFLVDLERFLARLDPFGPLADVFDLLQPQVVEAMRNDGRLYLEVKSAAAEVAIRLQMEETVPLVVDEEPKTMQMYGADVEASGDKDFRSTQVIGDRAESDDTSSEARDAIDEVVSAASGRDRSAPEPRPKEDDLETQVIEMDPDLLDEEVENESGDDDSEPIVLLDEESKTTSAPPPMSPPERVAELNRRREKYMEDEAWEKLADLYEDGIELFSEPEERQKVLLTLATLYEVKLRQKKDAFNTFGRAWNVRDADKGREKALSGLQRLGKSSGLHEHYIDWLQEQLSTELEPSIRRRFNKEFALGLFADQQFERAFESYASFVLDDPNQFVSDDTLMQLERLGDHVDDKELMAIFDDLSNQDLEPSTQKLVDEFVAQSSTQ